MSKEAKTDIPGIYRAPEGFLINKDNNALAAYKARKARDREIDILKEEVTPTSIGTCELHEFCLDFGSEVSV